jgi:prevent-host-death family protein
MQVFSFSDLSRRSGDVLDAALAGPVSLQKRGKTKLVILPIEEYQRLLAALRLPGAPTVAASKDPSSGSDPEDGLEALVRGLQEIIDDTKTR